MTIEVPSQFADFLKVFRGYSDKHIKELQKLLAHKKLENMDYAIFLRHSNQLIHADNDFSLYEMPVQFYAFLAEYLHQKNNRHGLDAFETGFCAILLHNLAEMSEINDNADDKELQSSTTDKLRDIFEGSSNNLSSILNNKLSNEDYTQRLHCALNHLTRQAMNKPELYFLLEKLTKEFNELINEANLRNTSNKYLISFIYSNPLLNKQPLTRYRSVILLVASYINELPYGLLNRFLSEVIGILTKHSFDISIAYEFVTELCNLLRDNLSIEQKLELANILQRLIDANTSKEYATDENPEPYRSLFSTFVAQTLYDNNLFFRDCAHLSRQFTLSQKFLDSNFFLLSVEVEPAILNILWRGELKNIDQRLIRNMACTDFNNPELQMNLKEVSDIIRLLQAISSFTHIVLQKSVVEPQRTRGFELNRKISSFFVDALDRTAPWWSAIWSHTSPVLRFKVTTDLNTVLYLSAIYKDGVYVIYNPNAAFGECVFTNDHNGKRAMNRYLKNILFGNPNAANPITSLVIVQYQGYKAAPTVISRHQINNPNAVAKPVAMTNTAFPILGLDALKISDTQEDVSDVEKGISTRVSSTLTTSTEEEDLGTEKDVSPCMSPTFIAEEEKFNDVRNDLPCYALPIIKTQEELNVVENDIAHSVLPVPITGKDRATTNIRARTPVPSASLPETFVLPRSPSVPSYSTTKNEFLGNGEQYEFLTRFKLERMLLTANNFEGAEGDPNQVHFKEVTQELPPASTPPQDRRLRTPHISPDSKQGVVVNQSIKPTIQ